MSRYTRYPIPGEQTRVRQVIKNSEFITTGTYVTSTEEARKWFATIRKEFSDARHNCPAYKVGYKAEVTEWSSDDGEPSGTAGKPMLSVLQGHDVGDIAVMVTRYSGGIKLGTGGLVRAYSSSVRQLLEEMPIVMKVAQCKRELKVDYARYERIKTFLEEYEAKIDNEVFSSDIVFSFQMPVDRVSEFDDALIELSLAQLQATTIES